MSPSRFDVTRPIPLLILGDGPDQPTGLGRIGHDLAWLFSSMPEFRVAYLGRQAFGRAKYPWQQYSFSAAEQWGEHRLAEAWTDFSKGVKGILFTVWDASRLLWLADPQAMPQDFQRLLAEQQFERWGYFMVDGAGADPECLPLEQTVVLSRFNRVLLASRWGCNLALRTIEPKPDDRINWMPHGINLTTFQPVERDLARSHWAVTDKDVVIGCVMSNQQRKHWPVVMEAIANMSGRPYLWMHADTLTGYWNLPALAIEYGLADRIFTDDRKLNDRELAMRYSACDATVVISGGEGFCYPVAESLACGCPVVVGDYGAARELAGTGVESAYSTLETSHNVRRAYYDPFKVAAALQSARTWDRKAARERVEHLDWTRLSIQWKKWIRRGLQ